MNSNTPHQPGDEQSHDYDARRDAEASAGNSYNDTYQRNSTAPDLDSGAPQLRSNDMRRMNRRAIGFLIAIVLLLVMLAFLLLKAATGPRQQEKQRAQTLEVPQLPQLPQPAAAKPIAQAPLPMPLPVQPLPVLPTPAAATPALPHGPSLLERREMAGDSDTSGAGTTAPASAPAMAPGLLSSKYGAQTSAKALKDPNTLLTQGTIIRCVLQTRIISDIPGFTSCVVTDPVYSFDGQHLLLPKGSKVLGQYDSAPVGSRIAVVWNRVLTPGGIDVNMSSPGVDNLGGSGLPGHLDSHWPSRISSALLISLLSDAFKYEAAKHGPSTTAITGSGLAVETPFQSNTAQTVQDLANQAVRASANRPATLTINQGSVISIYVARDVDFSGVAARL